MCVLLRLAEEEIRAVASQLSENKSNESTERKAGWQVKIEFPVE